MAAGLEAVVDGGLIVELLSPPHLLPPPHWYLPQVPKVLKVPM